MSYRASHCLYRFDQQGGQPGEAHCLRSRYLPDDLPLFPLDIPADDRVQIYHAGGGYENLVSTEGGLLRIASHDQPARTAEGDRRQKTQAPWSAMQVNPGGNCLGEALFPANTYDFNDLHACEEGWLVSLENDYNPENVEDTLSLVLMSW